MNKTYPTLYSRDSLGNVRIWSMETQGDQYRTTSGLQNGQLVVSEWTLALPKNEGRSNETTGEEQATAEVEAKYKKQLKTGYHKDLKDIDKVQYIEPILAKSYNDYQEKVDFTSGEWGAQTKYNGICCLFSKNGGYSRKGEKFLSINHLEKSLQPFFEAYPGAVLHGELFNDNYREQLNEIVKLVRKTVNITEEDRKNSEKLIKFHIYDGYGYSDQLNEAAPYEKRKTWIDQNVIGKYDYCVNVPTTVLSSKEELDELFVKAIERGDEGLILRKMSMIYKAGRSRELLKYKPTDTAEMTLLDVLPGNGTWAGKAKIINLRMDNGKEFSGTFKGSFAEAEKFLKEKQNYIGQRVTVSFFGYTGLGCPNFCQFDYNNFMRAD